MSPLLLVGFFLHGAPVAPYPSISLELRPVEKKPPAIRKAGPDAALEDLAVRSLERDRNEAVGMTVAIRASRSGDVVFNRNALTLEARDLLGAPLPTTCIHRRGATAEATYLYLRSGEMVLQGLWLSPACYRFDPGQRFTVVAVFEDNAEPFRPPPQAGASYVTKRVESNRVVVKWPGPAKGRTTRR